MRFALICLLLALAVNSSARGAIAQGTLPETVSPELCSVEPLTEFDLVSIVETAIPVTETDISSDENGSPANDETVAEITDVVRMSVACVNANDPMRSFALFSDSYLQARFGGENEDDLGHLLAAITRNPDVALDADRLTLDSIEDVRAFPDGRVAATVTTSNSANVFVDTLVFAQVSDEWKIDSVILGEPRLRATPEG
jgi:hypothetical protein